MKDKRRSGKALMSVVGLLVIGGLAGYNYHRNWQLERRAQGERPFAGYTIENLSALRDAYAADLEKFRKSYAVQQGQRTRGGGGGSIGQQIDRFARVQDTNSKLREINTEVAEREGRLREIDKELGYRNLLDGGLALHVQRLTSL